MCDLLQEFDAYARTCLLDHNTGRSTWNSECATFVVIGYPFWKGGFLSAQSLRIDRWYIICFMVDADCTRRSLHWTHHMKLRMCHFCCYWISIYWKGGFLSAQLLRIDRWHIICFMVDADCTRRSDCTRRLSIGTYYLAHMEYLCHDFQCVAALTIAVFAYYACNKDDLYLDG